MSGTLLNRAEVVGLDNDPNPQNNTAQEATEVISVPEQSIVEITDLPPDPMVCPNGGQMIEVGFDVDGAGILDADAMIDMIISSDIVCNGDDGAPGLQSLVLITDEPAGDNCPDGGLRIDSGIDDDPTNGVLDPIEIDTTEFVCTGDDGMDGMDGDDGMDGEQGDDGLISLTDIDIVPAGDQCPNGGLEIKTGIDRNSNGVLDPEEVTDSNVVCNGEDGTTANCSIAGPNTPASSMLGLLLYAMIPALILIRRRIRK